MAIDIVKTNTATRSDYLKSAAAYKSSEDSLSYWEQLLQPAQQQYQSEQQVASAQAGYDITSAYKNYLSQQQAIGSGNLLGTTQKELGKQAKSQYESSYSQAQSNLYSNLAQAQANYQKNYQTAYEQLEQTGKSLEEADVAILNYIQDYGVKLGYTEEELQNMYAVNPTTGQRELTDFGKNIYATAFDFGGREDSNPDNVIPSLRQYLAERGDTDVIDYIYQNRDLVTQSLAGFSGTQDYKTEQTKLHFEKNLEKKGDLLVYDAPTKTTTRDDFNPSDFERYGFLQESEFRLRDAENYRKFVNAKQNLEAGDIIQITYNGKRIYLEKSTGPLFHRLIKKDEPTDIRLKEPSK